tara:strand:- start:11303 stop:11905 length:603 start_codon:yes stop_codon:yes gene_type:complete
MHDENKVFDKIRPYFFVAAIMIALPSLLSLYGGQTGRLLVATQKMKGDPFFEQKVIYIFDHSFWGARGIIVNQPFENQSPEKFSVPYKNAHFYNAGPVHFPSLITVALSRPKKASRWRIQPLTIVDYKGFEHRFPSYAKEDAPLDFYVGYSGWDMGQLETEIKNGMWNIVDCNIKSLRDTVPSAELWSYLSQNEQKNICP